MGPVPRNENNEKKKKKKRIMAGVHKWPWEHTGSGLGSRMLSGRSDV